MIVCTVATTDYLAGTRVLGRSLADHHPDARLAALVVDDVEGRVGADEPFEVLRPADVGIDDRELARRALIYPPAQLACSLKADLIDHLLTDEPVAFLDSDCVVWAGLEPLTEVAADNGVALTAHSLTPVPAAGAQPVETWFLRHGTFNAGVLAVGVGGRGFLDWWRGRSARHCVADAEYGLAFEQGWLSLVPALFSYGTVRDPGVNVMGWNVHDRDVSWRDGIPHVPGGRLRCFHFAGSFDPHAPDRFGPGPDGREPWPEVADRPGVARLCADYAERLLAAGHDELSALRSPYELLPGGEPIQDLMRAIYRDGLLAAEAAAGAEPPNPFTDGEAEFLRWLASADDGAVSRYLAEIRRRRVDLLDAFPAVPGRDEQRYVAWAAEAADRGEIDLSWLPGA